MQKNHLLTIVGPTAIGKTALSIKLAQHFNTEVVSSDSRQFYREMNIGTAVPSPEELKTVKHHFIHSRSIHEAYSVGDFEKDAVSLLNQLFLKQRIIVMAGGSGLYVDAVTKGLDDFPAVDPEIRRDLKKTMEEKGIENLQNELKIRDPNSYQRMDIHNKQRLIRALEICIGSGLPYSHFLGIHQKKRDFSSIKIGLTADREIIYERINQRVDIMIAQGLVEEAEKLYPYKELNALQTVGYKELFAYFDKTISLGEAIREIKKNTRRFAKRQGTWFRRDPDIKWFDYQTSTEEILQSILLEI